MKSSIVWKLETGGLLPLIAESSIGLERSCASKVCCCPGNASNRFPGTGSLLPTCVRAESPRGPGEFNRLLTGRAKNWPKSGSLLENGCLA